MRFLFLIAALALPLSLGACSSGKMPAEGAGENCPSPLC
jgi:hypothetical protein